MDTSWLVGKTIKAVWTYAIEPVHPAWVNELTTSIATSSAFLELESGEFVRIAPCEVQIDEDKYPSLGLEFDLSTRDSARVTLQSGKTIDVLPLPDGAGALPLGVTYVGESDPLGQDTATQIDFADAKGRSVTFRHIMPPLTLGILVGTPGQAPNNSFKPKPLSGSA